MDVKTKKKVSGGIARLETSGEIKEVFVSEDFLKPEEANIQICFREEVSSGIVEMSKKEFEDVYKNVMKKAGLSKSSKVIKFEK